MKRNILQIVLLLSIVSIVLCAPLSAFAEVHDDIILSSPNHTKVAPDMHYILDDSKPYQMLFLGNDDIVSNGSSSQTMSLHNYQWLFVQTAGQPVEADNVIGRSLAVTDSDKSYSVYAAQSDDEFWTPIVVDGTLIDNLYIGSDDSGEWASSIIASNFDVFDVYNNLNTDYLSYFWYYYPDFSFLDYNGNLTYGDHILAYIKQVSHVFVRQYLKPFLDMIIDEPILFIICLSGLVISIVSSLYYFFVYLTNRKYKIRLR